MGTVLIQLAIYANEARSRGESLAKAEALIERDPDLFDGEPVFKGTRVPVRTITAWLAEGIDRERIRAAYPVVTDDMVLAAPVWAKAHPQRGRPRKFNEINPGWKLKSESKNVWIPSLLTSLFTWAMRRLVHGTVACSRKSYDAMLRASRAAIDLAIKTNTSIIVSIDGKDLRLTAQDLLKMREQESIQAIKPT
jgi:uncharacterized protein (DUF433 family)